LYLVKRSSDGKNILHLAALYQQRWLVKYIIDALPMIYFKLINDEDNDGLIPVDVACLTGNRDIAWDIATLENLDWRQPQDVFGRSAPPVLFSSCVAGTIGAFTNLLSSVINTVVLDRNGRNAFWYLIVYFRAEGKP
jgi:ankyrin repeat protein